MVSHQSAEGVQVWREREQLYVDDLEPLLQELLGLVGQMVGYPVDGRLVGLVDVDALDGAALVGRGGGRLGHWVLGAPIVRDCRRRGRAPDRVVEDEDLGGPGSGM